MASAMSKKLIFPLGSVVITRAASELAAQHEIDVSFLLYRHQTGDWGDLSTEDKESNEEALVFHNRLFSSYQPVTADGQMLTIWIITEWDRSLTTILLPEDY